MLTEKHKELKIAVEKTLSSLHNMEETAQDVLDLVVSDVLTKFHHKLGVGVEDSVADLLDDFKQKVVSQIINEADRWRIPKSDVVIFPRNCRFYYEKGDSTIVVIEDEPKNRTVKLSSDLVTPDPSEYRRGGYKLPMPYVVYVFHIKDLSLVNAYIGWRSTPLMKTTDKLAHPLLPNSHDNLDICWGHSETTRADSIAEVCESAITRYWTSTFNADLVSGWDRKGEVSQMIKDVHVWSRQSTMFMMQLDYHVPNDPSVKDKIDQITGHVEEPDMDKIRHRLYDLTNKHSDILFSKIIRYFKRVKPERFYPKDVTHVLKASLEECVRDYLDVFYVLQLEYNKLEKELGERRGRVTRKCGPNWDEEMKNG